MTCIGEFQPGNKTMYVVFDEESEFSGPRTPKLSLDQVLKKNVPPKKIKKIVNFLINLFVGALLDLGIRLYT